MGQHESFGKIKNTGLHSLLSGRGCDFPRTRRAIVAQFSKLIARIAVKQWFATCRFRLRFGESSDIHSECKFNRGGDEKGDRKHRPDRFPCRILQTSHLFTFLRITPRFAQRRRMRGCMNVSDFCIQILGNHLPSLKISVGASLSTAGPVTAPLCALLLNTSSYLEIECFFLLG